MGLYEENVDIGRRVAVDATDMRAHASGHETDRHGNERTLSDPDASWGHRSAVSTRKGGSFYGYKIHIVACVSTGFPLAWSVRSANEAESRFALGLLKAARDRGFRITTAIMDKAYDSETIHHGCMELGIAPVIPMRATGPVKRGAAEPRHCAHGRWIFAGADYQRRATKWRCPGCPTDQCSPASTWVKADRLHPLIPRDSKRFKDLYWERTAIEREFANLKEHWSLVPLRVRGLDRVRLHADLTILARLVSALVRARTAALTEGPRN
jgi:hypothetical protein